MAVSNETPFGMSFDELLAQVNGGGNAAQTEPAAPAPAQTATTPQETKSETPAAAPAQSTEELSFEELARRASMAAMQSETPADAEVSEESKEPQEESKDVPEETKEIPEESKDVPEETEVPEESKTDTADVQATETEETDVPAMNPPGEKDATEQSPGDKKPAKRSRKKKTKAAEPVEKPEDMTESYKVDVTGSAKEPEAAEGTKPELSMDVLFTPEEVAAIRKDIRTFVRKELKMAMVDAMKELLHDFSK